MNKYYFCFDVGGTFIKGAVIDSKYKIIYKDKVPTKLYFEYGKKIDKVFSDIINILEKGSNLSIKKASGVGVGIPGLVEESKCLINNMNSIGLLNYDLKKCFVKFTKAPLKMANDAECAGLAEYKFGVGKGYKNFVMITLGTGVGCCVIIDGVRLRSLLPHSCEVGHNFIYGTNDCFEELSSCRGLINATKKAMMKNKKSKMWKTYNLDTVSGKTVFEYLGKDETADKVFDKYIENLGVGIVDLYNVLTPDIIAIGGGLSAQKNILISPLKKYVDSHTFVSSLNDKTNIKIAKLQNDAGVLGARLLFDK